jgi:hypothetical protein
MKVANAVGQFGRLLTVKDRELLDKYGDKGIIGRLKVCRTKQSVERDKYLQYKLRSEIKQLERLLRLMTWQICLDDEELYEDLGYAQSNSFWRA